MLLLLLLLFVIGVNCGISVDIGVVCACVQTCGVWFSSCVVVVIIVIRNNTTIVAITTTVLRCWNVRVIGNYLIRWIINWVFSYVWIEFMVDRKVRVEFGVWIIITYWSWFLIMWTNTAFVIGDHTKYVEVFIMNSLIVIISEIVFNECK